MLWQHWLGYLRECCGFEVRGTGGTHADEAVTLWALAGLLRWKLDWVLVEQQRLRVVRREVGNRSRRQVCSDHYWLSVDIGAVDR